MAPKSDKLIPEWISIYLLCYHRILFTHIPGNHDASEACPLVDAIRRKIEKKRETPSLKKNQMLEHPEAHGSRPLNLYCSSNSD